MQQSSPKSQLWQILEDLRGEVMPHQICPQLAALIYLRWADFQEAEREAIAAFDDIEYIPVLPASLHWRSWHAFHSTQLVEMLGHRLPSALHNLGNARHCPLATHLHRMGDVLNHFGRWSPNSLKTLVDWLADQAFETPADRRRLLVEFDKLLSHSIKGTEGSPREHIDPAWISELVAELAKPTPGDRVYDPCFGTAGFLVAACHYLQANAESGFSRGATPPLSISGVDINPNAFVIGMARLALAGIDDPKLELGNSLERTASNSPHKEGFDLVVANPPWGMRIDPHGLDHFPIKSNDSTGLFIQHALSQLRPDGRAVIVAPQGVLFRGGQDQRLREMLLEQHSVEAVVSLSAGSFMPYTGVAASILVLRRKGPTSSVRMVNAEGLIERGRRSVSLGPDQIRLLGKLVRGTDTTELAWTVSVETLAESGWDLTPKSRDQSGLESILEALNAKTRVVNLKECCRILSGRPIKSTDLIDELPHADAEAHSKSSGYQDRSSDDLQYESDAPSPIGGDVIPYIRIGDLRNGFATKGDRWLGEQAMGVLEAKWKLKAGDVLLSKSGTIGKTGVVRNGAVGAVASNGLLVLRPDSDRLDPHYLAAYLDSTECHAWLDGRARGAVIRHLSKKVLEELPIPIPPVQVQQRVAEHHRENAIDVLSYLSQLLLEGEGDEIVEWMDDALRYLKSERTGKPHDLEPLLSPQVLGNRLMGLRNVMAHSAMDNPLAPWVLTLHAEVATALQDSNDVPQGTALYALLQQADLGLQRAQDAILGHLPHANRARDLTQLVARRVKAAMSYMVDQVNIVIAADSSRLDQDALVTVDLTITNLGSLPLRDFEIKLDPWTKAEQLRFLGDGATKTIHLQGQTPREQDHFTLKASWSAAAMNGRQLSGTRELAFELMGHTDVDTREEELGPSPYVCGDPITPKRSDVFVGREDLLERIRRQIKSTGNVVLLEGNRRAGKTSILKHLDGPNGVDGWLGVYTSLQGAEGSKDGSVGVPTDEVFRALAREIVKAFHALGDDTPLPNGDTLQAGKKPLVVPKACREGISSESPFSDFVAYVEVILECLQKHGLSLLLMLDEFDKLQEGIDNGVTSPQVPENIRFLVQNYPRVSAILTGSRRLKRLREEYWSALYGLGTRVGVTSLDHNAAQRLITAPVQGRLTYTHESIKRCIHLTAGQPFLLQCLCNRIFDLAAQLKTRSVTLDVVERAASALIEDNEHFASLWDYAGSDRKRFLLALCHREADGPDPIRLGVIQERLGACGIEVDDADIIADLDYLRELELIELVGESSAGHYELAIPLMGIWIDRQRDVDAILVGARTESEDSHA